MSFPGAPSNKGERQWEENRLHFQGVTKKESGVSNYVSTADKPELPMAILFSFFTDFTIFRLYSLKFSFSWPFNFLYYYVFSFSTLKLPSTNDKMLTDYLEIPNNKKSHRKN